MRILLPIITHLSTTAVGGAICAVIGFYYVTNTLLPDVQSYIVPDARFIQLVDGERPVEYAPILKGHTLGYLYFYHPLYKHEREKGKGILAKLAERGYTPAAATLYDYYITKSYDLRVLHEESAVQITDPESFVEAYKWARLMAEQGAPGSLSFMITFFRMDLAKDVEDDLELVEQHLPKLLIPDFSRNLSKYYSEVDKPEKAAYWMKFSKELAEKQISIRHDAIKPSRGFMVPQEIEW